MFPNYTRKTISRSAFIMLASLLAASSSKAQMKLGGVDGFIRKDAVLELGTQRKGLLLPRVDASALSAHPLDTSSNGMLLFNATTNKMMVKMGAGTAGWKPLLDQTTVDFLWSMSGNSNVDPAVNFLGTSGAQPLVFKTNLAEAMRIDPLGKVGIGTLYPNSRLHVNGSFATNVAINTTAAFTVADSNSVIIMNNTADATLTLPAAATYPGRALEIVAFNSNKITFAGATVRSQNSIAQTTLLPGYTARIVSNGTDWIMTARQRIGLSTFLSAATPTAENDVTRDYNAFAAKGSGLFVNDGGAAMLNPIPNETSTFATTWQGNNTTNFTQLNVNAAKAYFRSGTTATPNTSVWQKFLSVPAAANFNITADGTNNISLNHTDARTISIGTSNTPRISVAATGEVEVLSAFALPIQVVTAAYTLTEADHTVVVAPTGGTGTIQVTFPQASTCKGRIYVIRRVTNRAVQVRPNATDRFDNSNINTAVTIANNAVMMYQSDGGTRWYTIAGQ